MRGLVLIALHSHVLLSLQPAWSQHYHFEQYGIRDGLPHAEVYDIIQADDHTLWLATDGGASRFNGYTFTNYTTRNGLHSNEVSRVFQDRSGGIWIGHSAKGVNYIRHDSVYSMTDLNQVLGSSRIRDMAEGCDGSVYFFSPAGIVAYQDGEVEVLLDSLATQSSASAIAHAGMVLADCQTLIAGNFLGNVYTLSLADGEVNFLEIPGYEQEKLPIYSFTQDDLGRIWIGGMRLYLYDGHTVVEMDVPPRRHQDMQIRHDGTLVSALEGHGFGLFDPLSGEFTQVDRHKGFPAIYNYAICEDHEQNIWIGTYGEGLAMSRDLSTVYYDETNGLRSTLVLDFAEWNDALYIATNGGTFRVVDNVIVDTLFTFSSCRSLDILANGNLLVGTHRGIREVDPQGRIKRLTDFEVYGSLIIDGSIWYKDGRGMHSLAADLHLNLRSQESTKWGPYTVLRNKDEITFLKESQQLAVAQTGLEQYTGYRSMDLINDRELLLLSDHHIHYLTLIDSKVTAHHIDISSDSDLDMANSILVDDKHLWISSRNHIYALSLTRLLEDHAIEKAERSDFGEKLSGYLMDDGMWRDGKGKIWCKTLNQLWAFDPRQNSSSAIAPQPSIHSVKVNQIPVEWPSAGRTPMSLDYRDNHLSIAMQAGSFAHPAGVQYRHRLLGLSGLEDWSPATLENEVVFSYRPDGDYQFEFVASNGHGVWSDIPVKFSFDIARPYWRRPNFWISATGLFLILILGAISYDSRLKARHRQEVLRRTYGAHEEERLRLSREIHDSIGQQLSFMHRRLKKNGNMEMAKMTQSVLAESRTLSMGLHPPSLSRFGLHAALSDLLDQLESQHLITVIREIERPDDGLNKEEETHFYRIAQECLHNIIKHAHADQLIFSLMRKDDAVVMRIEDNGVGFSFDSDAPPSGGLGLVSVAERCQMIRARLDIDSIPGAGTTILISKSIDKPQ
ncbi:MAG: hypothetical protein KTR24_14230 [Saprospiraceae bacterium]|nr:hypothetical protein [Saprospiraceae bacterium]